MNEIIVIKQLQGSAMMLLKIFDIGLTLFHSSLILFNLFGWCFPKTRRANLVSLLVTFFSWFGLGFFYGLGYCPLTEWHWNIKEKLGATSLPNSYIKYLVDNILSVDANAHWIDIATFGLFIVAIVCSLSFNLRKIRKPRL